ncbi:hypothetical protein CCACVL1_20782 [Corchorus capsularis]|uniref:Uncharacterized protein n=1 Tax=Corchorus capsularis TaxID=210143 RepID=A0A1R3H9Z3_COCAP|nr:hypothetical protein CCACVL1_20782 [Corchorus capsularis]
MSVSMEALAMAGADYVEWGMDIEEWEHEDHQDLTPAYLLADEEEEEEQEIVGKNVNKSGSPASSLTHFDLESQILLRMSMFDIRVMASNCAKMLEFSSL